MNNYHLIKLTRFVINEVFVTFILFVISKVYRFNFLIESSDIPHRVPLAYKIFKIDMLDFMISSIY